MLLIICNSCLQQGTVSMCDLVSFTFHQQPLSLISWSTWSCDALHVCNLKIKKTKVAPWGTALFFFLLLACHTHTDCVHLNVFMQSKVNNYVGDSSCTEHVTCWNTGKLAKSKIILLHILPPSPFYLCAFQVRQSQIVLICLKCEIS